MISKLKLIGGLVFGLGGLLGFAAFTFWALWFAAHHLTLAECRRFFYGVCIPVIFFYVTRSIRAVAKYFEAKARAQDRRGS